MSTFYEGQTFRGSKCERFKHVNKGKQNRRKIMFHEIKDPNLMSKMFRRSHVGGPEAEEIQDIHGI